MAAIQGKQLALILPDDFAQELLEEMIKALDMASRIRRTILIKQGKLNPAIPPLATQVIALECKKHRD